MTPQPRRLEQVRRVLAAGGGWNRRSRGALLAWARGEGLSDAELSQLLSQALGIRVPSAPPLVETPRVAVVRASAPRWWLAVISVLGLGVSGWLAMRLAGKMDTSPAPATPAVSRGAPPDATPVRTQPPPPVPFSQPPGIDPSSAARPAEAEQTPAGLGPRPAGELSRVDLKRFADAWLDACTEWPERDSLTRAADLRELAAWMAGCVSARDAEQMEWARLDARERARDARAQLLDEAFDAMLWAEIAHAPELSSEMAGRIHAPPVASARDALKAWALSKVDALARGYAAADARERWQAWIQSVSTLSDPAQQAECALAALDAILRVDAPLDRAGLAADAAGSMVALLPRQPSQPGFQTVREAWTRWLTEPSLRSSRLWALGGVWRARDAQIDPSLLPGERDDAAARARLAARWRARADQSTQAWWAPLRDAHRTPHPAADAPAVARLQDLADRIRILRQLGHGAGEAPPAVATVRPSAPADPAADAHWSRDLLDEHVETRLRALRVMRAAAPTALAPADAEALAGIAISGATLDEVQLAQDVVRASLQSVPVMREAAAHALALASEPLRSADFVQAWVGRPLPVDGSDALRAWAIAELLRRDRAPLDAAADRLASELRAWRGATSERSAEDAGVQAWERAASAAKEVSLLHVPAELQPLASGMDARVRRLRRIAPEGPRGLAAALAVLCDAEAVRGSVRRSGDAGTLRLLADGASARRASAADALAQIQASIDALSEMALLWAGAPPEPAPAALVRPPADAQALVAALGPLDLPQGGAPADARAARAALAKALRADPDGASSVALGMAQLADQRADRRRWLECAAALGAGSMLPDMQAERARDALELARVLAWSRRAAVDQLGERLLRESRPRTMQAVQAFAQERGVPAGALLKVLRTPADPAWSPLLEALRARVAATLGVPGVSWSDALEGGAADPVPEADAAQPWRLALPGS